VWHNFWRKESIHEVDWNEKSGDAPFLGIWLILTGALAFVHVTFAHTGLILSALTLAAGVLILLGR
jgi:hypothetical protein